MLAPAFVLISVQMRYLEDMAVPKCLS